VSGKREWIGVALPTQCEWIGVALPTQCFPVTNLPPCYLLTVWNPFHHAFTYLLSYYRVGQKQVTPTQSFCIVIVIISCCIIHGYDKITSCSIGFIISDMTVMLTTALLDHPESESLILGQWTTPNLSHVDTIITSWIRSATLEATRVLVCLHAAQHR